MKPGVFLKLLNKKFKVLFSNQIFFKSEGLIIESQGTKDTIIREGIPPVQVKVTNWFDNIWLYIKVEFKYVGFSSENAKQNFAKKVENIHSRLCKLLEDKYTVKNMIDIQTM